MDAHQRGHRRAGAQVLAGRDLSLAHGAVDGGDDHGIGELLAGQLQLGSALGQHGLPVADLLERVLVPPFRHLEVRLGGVKLRPGDELLFDKLYTSVAGQTRLVEHGPGLPHDRGLLGFDHLVLARRRQSQPGAGLLQRRLGLFHPQLEVRLVEPGDRLAPAHPGAQVDVDRLDPAGHLGAQGDLVLGGQGPGRRHRSGQRPLGGRDHADLAGRGGLRLGRFLSGGRVLTPAAHQPQGDQDDEDQGSAGHPNHDISAAREESDEDEHRGDELQEFLAGVQGQPADVAEWALEDLDSQEQHEPERRRLSPRLPQPVQRGPPQLAHVHEQPDADRGRRPDHDHGRRQPRRQRILRAHEESRGDHLRAEHHPVEVDLADADQGHRRNDGDLQRDRLAGAPGRPSLAEREHAAGGGQQHLQPLDHVVLVDQPGAERGIDGADHEEDTDDAETHERGDTATVELDRRHQRQSTPDRRQIRHAGARDRRRQCGGRRRARRPDRRRRRGPDRARSRDRPSAAPAPPAARRRAH